MQTTVKRSISYFAKHFTLVKILISGYTDRNGRIVVRP